MKSLIKASVIIFEFLRSMCLIIGKFILWTFANKVTATIFILCVVAVISWAVGFITFVDEIKKTRSEIISENPEMFIKTDAIVVLTGGSERLRHALYLLSMGYADRLFISGVNKEVKLNELLVLHGYSKEMQDAIRDRIELGYSAVDTIQNSDEIADWVNRNNVKSIRLVTSNYHIKRALLEIQRKIPDVKIIPYGVIPLNIRIDKWWDFPSTRELLVNEYNKFLAANIRIFLENFGF